MQVICKRYDVCSIRDTCTHAKEHKLVDNFEFTAYGKIIDADNCHLNEGLIKVYCHCDSKFLRKMKLEKLNKNR